MLHVLYHDFKIVMLSKRDILESGMFSSYMHCDNHATENNTGSMKQTGIQIQY